MRKKMTFREDQITDMILYMVGSIDSEKEPDEQQRIENLKRLLQIIDELVGEIGYITDPYNNWTMTEESRIVLDWMQRLKRLILWVLGEEEEGC